MQALHHVSHWLRQHLNFFRVHLLVFTISPLIVSGIFYAANGAAPGNVNSADVGVQHVAYIDSLFLCFSAMTVTGLVTVNVSATHPFQQFLLAFLFIAGDYSVVSLVMVLVRKRFFREHCRNLLENDHFQRTNTVLPQGNIFTRTFTLRPISAPTPRVVHPAAISAPKEGRRLGTPVEERLRSASPATYDHDLESHTNDNSNGIGTRSQSDAAPDPSDRGAALGTAISSPQDSRGRLIGQAPSSQAPRPARAPMEQPYSARQRIRAQSRGLSMAIHTHSLRESVSSPALIRHPPVPSSAKDTGFGGFPGPIQLFLQLLPTSVQRTIQSRASRPVRKMTLLLGQHEPLPPRWDVAKDELWTESVKSYVARWLPDSLGAVVVGRNSRFYTEELDDVELEKLGGVEYRALRLLSYWVAAYIVLFQAIPFAVIAIYLSKIDFWDAAFTASGGVQAATVNKTWSSLFVTIAAYTGAGMSLVDQSMVPFATCYLLIYVLDIVMLVGNHALPMTLRLIIWLGTKVWRQGETNETLHFLLDHPRRCYIYLFPSHQTWYLVLVLLAFIGLELFSFLVLNIGLSVLNDLGSAWQMFSDALLQSLSVRAAGFGIVSVSALAPSVLFVYVILMYVAIYPIAMSVRSTNVYEERALGIFNRDEEQDTVEGPEPEFKGPRREVFSKYLLWHIRRQLAFDIWPLALAIFVICCLERGKLLDPERAAYFTIFRIIFECTSAYSTIGLSLGTPNNNYSFSGELGTASKIVMIAVMLRGRHRGLPVAIDRAVLLPKEYTRIDRRTKEPSEEEPK